MINKAEKTDKERYDMEIHLKKLVQRKNSFVVGGHSLLVCGNWFGQADG